MGKFYEGWIASESQDHDSIKVKRLYVDINEGNWYDAALFSQIMYWHGNSLETGERRLKIFREGYYWLAKRYEDWWKECRVNEVTAKKSIVRMEERGLIVKEVWMFSGKPTVHLRVNIEGFEILANHAISEAQESSLIRSNGSEPSDLMDLNDQIPEIVSITESTTESTKDLPPLAAAALPLVGIRSFQAPDTKVSEGDEPALKKGRKKSQPELAMIVMSIYDKTRMSAENLAAFQAECDLYSTDPIYKGWFDMICRPTLTFTDANGKLVRKKIPEVIELIQMHIGLDKYRQNHSGIAESSATQEVIEDQDWMSKVYEPKSPSAL